MYLRRSTDLPSHATQPYARLTLLSRECLLRRHMNLGESLSAVVAQAEISLRTAYTVLAQCVATGATDGLQADCQGPGSSPVELGKVMARLASYQVEMS